MERKPKHFVVMLTMCLIVLLIGTGCTSCIGGCVGKGCGCVCNGCMDCMGSCTKSVEKHSEEFEKKYH